jgi:hypothetical protein
MNSAFQLSLVSMTLVVTVAAFLLAVYFMFRRRLILAGVCLLCFILLLRPGVIYFSVPST